MSRLTANLQLNDLTEVNVKTTGPFDPHFDGDVPLALVTVEGITITVYGEAGAEYALALSDALREMAEGVLSLAGEAAA